MKAARAIFRGWGARHPIEGTQIVSQIVSCIPA